MEFFDRETIVAYLLERFERPRNRGHMEGEGVVSQSGGNPGCGDVVTLHVRAEPDGAGKEKIGAIKFEGKGCTISMAAADVLADLVAGKSFEEVAAMDAESLIDRLGREVVIVRLKCATLALNTLKAAIERHRRNQVRRALGLSPEPSPQAPPDLSGMEGGPDPFGHGQP
jgi:nitrogen fixation NifU-like protein